MGISNVSEVTTASAPAIPVPAVASAQTAAPTTEQKQSAPAVAAEPTPASPPPPPPEPIQGFDFEVSVGEHAGTGHKVYGFIDPDSGETVVQIPAKAVLDLVASILNKLEAEGLR